MEYKIQFLKIDKNNEFAGVGFAGNIFIILNALNMISNNDSLYVDMETNECACTEKDKIFDTYNCWEYYFEQKKSNKQNNYILLNNLISCSLSYSDKSQYLYPKKYLNLKEKFYNNFKFKKYINEDINDYFNKYINNKYTLGVQIRLTDMKMYHGVADTGKYIEKINNILKENTNIQQIFLATDDFRAIEAVKRSVRIPVIYHEDMFRAKGDDEHNNPYDRFKKYRNNHRYLLGYECIKEIFILSKCTELLMADVSALSNVSVILSDNINRVHVL